MHNQIHICQNNKVYVVDTDKDLLFSLLFMASETESKKYGVQESEQNKIRDFIFIEMIKLAFNYTYEKYNEIFLLGHSLSRTDHNNFFEISMDIICKPIIENRKFYNTTFNTNFDYDNKKIIKENNIDKIKNLKTDFINFFKHINQIIR
jgi:hypothetical protein